MFTRPGICLGSQYSHVLQVLEVKEHVALAHSLLLPELVIGDSGPVLVGAVAGGRKGAEIDLMLFSHHLGDQLYH
jgi:hypothetical protein